MVKGPCLASVFFFLSLSTGCFCPSIAFVRSRLVASDTPPSRWTRVEGLIPLSLDSWRRPGEIARVLGFWGGRSTARQHQPAGVDAPLFVCYKDSRSLPRAKGFWSLAETRSTEHSISASLPKSMIASSPSSSLLDLQTHFFSLLIIITFFFDRRLTHTSLPLHLL